MTIKRIRLKLTYIGFVHTSIFVTTLTFGQNGSSGSDIIDPKSRINEVFAGREGYFLEGPTTTPDGTLYFTDITFTHVEGMKAGINWNYNPQTGEAKVFRSPSGMANGLSFDAEGNLIASKGADFGGRRIIKTDMKNGKSSILAGLFNSKPLVSFGYNKQMITGFAQQPMELDNWKFKTGDNYEWAKIEYDDASWAPIKTSMSWETQGYRDYDGYAWYRVKFFLPMDFKKNDQFDNMLKITLGQIDDCDQTFLNGKLIGQNGKIMTTGADDMSKLPVQYGTYRNYILPATDSRLYWGKENVIAIRVFDAANEGGMWNGTPSISPDTSNYMLLDKPTSLFNIDADNKARVTITLKNNSSVPELKGTVSVKAETFLTPNKDVTQSFDVVVKAEVLPVNFTFDADRSKWIKATFTFTEEKTRKTVSMVWSNILPKHAGTRPFDSLWNAKRQTRMIASNPAAWKPVNYKTEVPNKDVTLAQSSLFKPVMERNEHYLLNSFTVNHMLHPFLERAGKPLLPDNIPQVGYWETFLRGSNAGRFLMGAGNSLRWMENKSLRDSLNKLIDGIETCREPSGYILPYPHDLTKIRDEEPGYARAWLTHGLIEAGIAGNPKAYPLLRGHADYFNKWDELLPKLIYWSYNGHQGHIASTRTYYSAVGKPEDLSVAEKYYVCDWWMEDLIARKPEAIWQYPLSTPHCYLLTGIEPYLDHYHATGDKKYLDASLGGWDLFHNNWEHVGGSIAICESQFYPPKSYYITGKDHTGEICGSSFWIKLNQRLHQLFPEDEKYMNEIEKSLYNVILACQQDDGKVRYHRVLEGEILPETTCSNTCCEAQGTRILGALPEFIYSKASDGLYINLYEPSSINLQVAGTPISVSMESTFPYNPHITIKVSTPKAVKMKIRVRIPAWASDVMAISVNKKQIGKGKPGSYVTINRQWSNNDVISFDLPIDIRVTPYTGLDTISGYERYALEYGPILLSAVGEKLPIFIKHDPKQIKQWLTRNSDKTLDFSVKGQEKLQFVPYFKLKENLEYTCFPVIGHQ